jgi:hypothetical protein
MAWFYGRASWKFKGGAMGSQEPEEPESYWALFVRKIDTDWYEFTHLGFSVRVRYAYQVARYYLGLRKDPVDRDMEFPEWDWDFDFIAEERPANRRLALAYALVIATLLAVSAGLALAGEDLHVPFRVLGGPLLSSDGHTTNTTKGVFL